MQQHIRSITISLIILLIILTGFMSYYTVPEGYKGIQTRFNRITAVTDPGLHFKTPFITSVSELPTKTQTLGKKIQAYTKDQQGAEVYATINYILDPVKMEEFYRRYTSVKGFETSKLTGVLHNTIEDVLGKYNAINAVQERTQLVKDITIHLKDFLKGQPIIIESIQLEKIDFSDEYERSVENRMKAEVEVATARQNLEQEKIQADIIRTQAQAQADSRLINAKAEAEAIEIKAKALEKQGQSVIELEKAKRWNGQLPQTILGNGSNTLFQIQ